MPVATVSISSLRMPIRSTNLAKTWKGRGCSATRATESRLREQSGGPRFKAQLIAALQSSPSPRAGCMTRSTTCMTFYAVVDHGARLCPCASQDVAHPFRLVGQKMTRGAGCEVARNFPLFLNVAPLPTVFLVLSIGVERGAQQPAPLPPGRERRPGP
eukprot:2342560-Pleurochrysis_carterae.AAC.3